MAKKRPYCLAIGGFDPSGGAGILADIKTMEQHNVYGIGIITANTVQTDSQYIKSNWLPFTNIQEQLELTLTTYPINVCKIGLVKDFKILQKILTVLITYRPKIKIIWDPVFSASAGVTFHKDLDIDTLSNILDSCFLVTPNIPEFDKMALDMAREDALSYYRTLSYIFLKGGHTSSTEATDTLYLDEEVQNFSIEKADITEKHGTGCILSSSIAANITLRNDISTSCKLAKEYTYKVIKSNHSKLGYHNEND